MTESSPQPDTFYALPEDLHKALWGRIEQRLQNGDVLITNEQFQQALEQEYTQITGNPPSADLRSLFKHAITSFNLENPQTYLVPGLQNGVARAFQAGISRLEWNVDRIETEGPQVISNFKQRERVRQFLTGLRVAPDKISTDECVRATIADLASQQPEIPTPPPAPPPVTLTREAMNALDDGDIDRRDVDERIAAQEKEHERIEKREIQRLPRRVYTFVDQGLLTQEEGGQIVKLHSIDQQVSRGELTPAEGGKARGRLMDRKTRTVLDKKLKNAVDYAVLYLQVFEALRRLSPEYDDSLRFLIRHSQLATPNAGPEPMTQAIQELLDAPTLLENLAELMERKDQEVRMIAVSLPPYSHIARRRQGPINMIIEESFIDDLRNLSTDEMSERLNDADRDVRTHAAAAMQCLIALIENLLKPTALRKEVRLLRIQFFLEEFYHETNDLGAARSQAADVLKRRIRKMYPDFSQDERVSLQNRTDQMLDSIEKRVLAQRQAKDAQRTGSPTRAVADDDLNLTPEETQSGAVLGRVQLRIPGGNYRNVRYRIMPDPDDPERHVVAQRDPDSGQLVPLLRNGAKRPVVQERNGLWRPVS